MLNDSDRDSLLAQQEELLRCLLCGDSAPAGIAPNEAKESADALLMKRRRAVERSQPSLVDTLGRSVFEERFREYSLQNPSVHSKGSCADASSFRKFAQSPSPSWCQRIFEVLRCRRHGV